VVGKAGRGAVKALLKGLVSRHGIDLTIANGENMAGGLGITRETAAELLEAGVQVITTGNHVWRQRDAAALVSEEARVLRPANYPALCPGLGAGVYTSTRGVRVGVLNLIGRTFMEPVDCPFQAADREMPTLQERAKVVVVDVHAEATSEKIALGRYLEGRASAVIGTHTHVQTADECIFPGGTAYLTDVGMTGPRDSVLGVQVDPVISRFRTGMPHRFELAPGPVVLSAVVVDIDEETGQARGIERVAETFE
jgi:metallophosphoesterase (TIGR00282 family)